MATVVRFTLDSQRTFEVPGVGFFRAGILDVPTDRPMDVVRARFRLQPYAAVEVGVVDAAAAPPSLPIPPTTTAPDQPVTAGQLAAALAGLGGGAASPDASTSTKGLVRLAGVLGGTAAAPTAFGLASADALTEAIQDTVAGMVRQGSNVTITYDDAAGTLTFTAASSSSTTPPSTAVAGFGDSFGTAFGGTT